MMTRARAAWVASLVLVGGFHPGALGTEVTAGPEALDPERLAAAVTIYRDEWGVPHIDGENDEAAVFGLAHAQAEDYFWQVEDTYIASLGRAAEASGGNARHGDLLNRAFQIVPEAKKDFATCDEKTRRVCEAYAAGLNHFLATHPEVTPRLLTRFEGWHVLACNRHIFLDFTLMTHFLPREYMGSADPSQPRPIAGSNAWAIGPKRTKAGSTILFCNPHQPGFGYGQMVEVHLKSGEGWDFTGATFFGSPLPGMGHNEHLGWSHTVNRPDSLDYWIVTFDKPDDPDAYRFGAGYRKADSWTDTFKIRRGSQVVEETARFRKTVHGPIIARLDETRYVALGIARIDEAFPTRQHLRMVRARDLDEFRAAMSGLDLFFFNTVYADRAGNIYFVYNGTIPRRAGDYNWRQKLDGSDPGTLWQGLHAFAELPQVTNPASGWLQSCNSTPYTVTDDGSPLAISYPEYLAEDGAEDKLRSKISRMILRDLKDATRADVERLAFDTRMYWPLNELPRYRVAFRDLEGRDPTLAARARPYLEHLLDWDCRNTNECTRSTLIEEWYRVLHGTIYPPDGKMLVKYSGDPDQRFEALIEAAGNLEKRFGTWKVAWGDVHRLQRHANVADFVAIPFSDKKPSLPCAAVPGGLGAVFTQYYTPSISIPLVREAKRHYGVVGTSYLAVFEFGKDRIDGVSLTHFGTSSSPSSPHYFDQARLVSEQRLRPALFDWDEIRAKAKERYHPGKR